MTSTHKRNVRGMHSARRCEARTKSGKLCSSPAITDKAHCHVHGGKGIKSQSYTHQFSDFTKAGIERDRQVTLATREVDKIIRKLSLGGSGLDQVDPLRKIRRRLLDLNQQPGHALTEAYAPSPMQREVSRQTRASLAYARTYNPGARLTMEQMHDRAMGAMLGLAVGEAVGITLEGQPRDGSRQLSDLTGGGILGLERGQWAGDTAMALALAQSLEFMGDFNATDFMDRLNDWARDGDYACTGSSIGIGDVTSDALARYRHYEDPFAGDPDPDCLDSGSLVRVAPAAIRYWQDRGKLRTIAARQSETTHASSYVVQACVVFADILADAISGEDEAVFCERWVEGTSLIASVEQGSWKRLVRDEVRSTNNALTLLDAALWCVRTSDTFEEAVLIAANLGHDAGTVAALTGQLAGALYGASSIPEAWLSELAWYARIEQWTEPLVKLGIKGWFSL